MTTAFDPRTEKILKTLAALGFLAGAWALFLWWQLLRARSGFDPVCAFGSSDCGQLWNSDFASGIHRLTRLPVAAWGVAWAIGATALPLRALAAKRGGLASVRLFALGGLVGMVALLVASAAAGAFCTSCGITYVLTALYAALALWGLRTAGGGLRHGLMPAVVAIGIAWLALLIPGQRTPPNLMNADLGGDLPMARSDSHADHDHGHAPEMPANGDSSDASDLAIATWPLDSAEQDRRIRAFIAEQDPRTREFISQALQRYRDAPTHPGIAPRDPHGDPRAPVLIRDFTDTQCGHCAELFGALRSIDNLLPDAAFAIDSRHFPLDGNCNPHLEIRGPEQVRCLAARARICMEGDPDRDAYELELYRNQQGLSAGQVYSLAAPYIDRQSLEACVKSPETAAKLRQDVDFAALYNPTGTPLVLVNDRLASPLPHLLYLLILAEGDPGHPAFMTLPPPPAS